MKRCLLLVLSLCNLLCISARNSFDEADFVKIKGNIYIWTLEGAHDANASMGDFDDIPGGYYKTAPNLYVEAEFGGLNIDRFTYTDDNGRYFLSKRNPWWGKYRVNIEVRAQVKLDSSNSEDPNTISAFPAGTDLWLFYEGRTNIYPYNGETDTISVSKGETVVMDVYIGGPGFEGGFTVTDWWEESPGDNLIGFNSVEMIRDAYRWAVDRGIPASDIYRSTSFMYPVGDIPHYAPFNPPPGVGHIEMNLKKLYPDEVVLPMRIGQNWWVYRGTLTHEYGHKIMHDVYTVLPMGFQEPKCTGHNISSAITGECGLVEGWAEFFSAAVLDYPTANGTLEGDNIEHTYHPHPDWISGTFTWRDDVTDGSHDICEGENAAVLWDIYDPKGWEYQLPEQQRNARALVPAWPTTLRWFDRLNDRELDDIWAILREDDPDRLTDEGAWFDYTNDGFWKYWRDRFSSDGDKIHGLKAILFNREIETDPITETAPSIEIISIDQSNRIAQIRITEADEEDRPYLYYNIAYRKNNSGSLRLLHNTDTSISGLGGTWQGDTLTVNLRIPSAQLASEMVFMVHDSMIPSFIQYTSIPDEEETEAEGSWQELSMEDMDLLPGLYAGGRMQEKDGILYVAAESYGLRIYDLRTDPAGPIEIGSVNEKGFTPWCIDLEEDEVYIADGDDVFRVDVSKPSDPKVLSTISFNPPADVKTLGIDYYDGLVYYTAGYLGMYILQPEADGGMTIVGRYENEDCTSASDVVVFEDTVYLVCEYTGLQILDISNDAIAPSMVGSWQIDTPSPYNNGVRLYEDIVLDPVKKRLYLGITWDGVYVLELSSPQQPVVQAVIKPSGAVMGLSISDDVIYTVEGWPQGSTAIDISDIDEPIELAYLEREHAGVNILVVGDYAYVGHSNGLMRLIRIKKP